MSVTSRHIHPLESITPELTPGIIEKIEHLRQLGVNAVELMPIFDFDEFENSRKNEETGELLVNHWGYSTVGFFAPKAGFARLDS